MRESQLALMVVLWKIMSNVHCKNHFHKHYAALAVAKG